MKHTVFIFVALLTSLSAFDEAMARHQLEAAGEKHPGRDLYLKHCARCHHADRIGISGPPLLPRFLRKYPVKKLIPMIRSGFDQTLMPKFENLSTGELLDIARYIKSPVNLKQYRWGKEEIGKTLTRFDDPAKPLPISNMADVTPVVERDGGKVWIMEDEKILAKFPLANVAQRFSGQGR